MIRFRFVDDAKNHHSVKRLCEVLKLNRSSYYKWKKTSTTRKKRLLNDAILGAKVKSVFTKERGCYPTWLKLVRKSSRVNPLDQLTDFRRYRGRRMDELPGDLHLEGV